MTNTQRTLTLAAGVVIVALTVAAFWLSYAHLHTVAADHGLGVSPARAWAWPATLDLFIVSGELLMLRASLARVTDWWAVLLVVVGSGGSIALNVLGVDGGDPLAYVTAAVPPTAALLAFGALMRQVHTLIAGGSEAVQGGELNTAPNTELNTAEHPVFAPVSVELSAPFEAPAATSAAPVPPQVMAANTPTVGHDAPATEANAPAPAEAEEVPARLSTEEAREVIEQCWANGLGVRATARRSTRSPGTVSAAFARLEKERGPQPIAGQLALVK